MNGLAKVALVVAGLIMVATVLVPSTADAACGGYRRYRWTTHPGYCFLCTQLADNRRCTVTGFNSSATPRCHTKITVHEDQYSCTTDEITVQGGNGEGAFGGSAYCPCDLIHAASLATMADGSIKPGTDACSSGNCLTSSPEPPQCDARDTDQLAPFNEGCGDDEHRCSAGGSDSDGAPVRFSSGRVEGNPITLFQVSAPGEIFFGYRIQWGSHVAQEPATARTVHGIADPGPTIHGADESTHFLGKGWLDDFSDRLYVTNRNKPAGLIVWRRRGASVTFSAANGWKSWSGTFQLVDRGANPADGLGRWVIRTTDANEPSKIWSFEEQTFIDYASPTQVFTLGRLRRHAVLAPGSTDLIGRYGFDLNWTTSGTLQSVVDTFQRRLEFEYSAIMSGTTVRLRTLERVRYRPNPSAAAIDVVSLQGTANQWLDRVTPLGASTYTRFLYLSIPRGGGLVTKVIAPGPGQTSSPAPQAPHLPGEIALEENHYDPVYPVGNPLDPGYSGWDSYRSTRSRYPGREFAYEFTQTGATQFDLHQPGVSCASGCPEGTACRSADGRCYVADVMERDPETRLPTSRASAGSTGGTGNANAFSRAYGASGTTSPGAPLVTRDASGMRTTYGFDTSARVRCIVRDDDDDQAFTNPAQPNTSSCAGPSSAQIVRVDYNGPCTDGFSKCTIKRTPSVLGSGEVVEEEDFDPATGLSIRTKTTGLTRDIDGSVVTQIRTRTKAYDTAGRLIETNGPLDDTVALDKTTTTYYSTFDAASPFDLGQLRSVTRYVGTSASSAPLTTTYAEYDLFGVPHRVTAPSGEHVLYTPSANRLEWTITQKGSDGSTIGTSSLKLDQNGSVRSATDADGICTTFEYTDFLGYVGAPTAIRRSASTDGCGVLPIDRNSGEVELRTYVAGERDRLQSVTRQSAGVVQFMYSGFVYDRARRLVQAATLDSAEPFRFDFTDVLPAGGAAPESPGPGTWRTETTADALARPGSLLRAIDASNKQSYLYQYASPFSPRPTRLARGFNGSPTSITEFVYDDFARLVETTVPEAGSPASPSPSRFEYDVADRMTKQRVAAGTSAARTSLVTYDSLDRRLFVDNDVEHPVRCGGAPPGTPIQDEEYRYDACPAPDAPAGVTCTNALGRLAIARSILQCGSAEDVVKRGRWYDYNAGGRVARVAYATVTAGTIGAPAIMDYTHTAAGRTSGYTSPINSMFGTSYTFGAYHGRVTSINSGVLDIAGGGVIARDIEYSAFGPMTALKTVSEQVVGSSSRTLTLQDRYRSNYTLSSMNWSFDLMSGPPISPISILTPSFTYTPAGLTATRTDTADNTASRFYRYDALLRLTCEARGRGASLPTSADCNTASPRLAGLFTYGNGESASSPQDVRLTSFLRSANYVSPSLETSSYAGGSSQLQGIARTGSSLVVGHDALGRRTFDFDDRDPSSRRNYRYLPNGQLGAISLTPAGKSIVYAMRYDEVGHPVTIARIEDAGASDLVETYELFWDDASRLIAVQITPPGNDSARPTTIRWHYHYLGDTLLAATREMVYSVGTELHRFWVITDERGLAHRLVDHRGATFWQAHWDAGGVRSYVGVPQPEMWIPFGLKGQIVLGETRIRSSGPCCPKQPGTEAYATVPSRGTEIGSGQRTSTRPPIALNQWRAFDPLSGAFLQPDGADVLGRTTPEGYLAFRANPLRFSDGSGWESRSGVVWDSQCTPEQNALLESARVNAIVKLSRCKQGACANANIRRNWLYAISNASYSCGTSIGLHTGDLMLQWLNRFLNGSFWAVTNSSLGLSRIDTWIAHAQFGRPLNQGSNACLPGLLAHEALHPPTHYLDPFGVVVGTGQFALGPPIDVLGQWRLPGSVDNLLEGGVEQYIEDAITDCKVCGP